MNTKQIEKVGGEKKKYLVEILKTTMERWIVEADSKDEAEGCFDVVHTDQYEFVEGHDENVVASVIREIKE